MRFLTVCRHGPDKPDSGASDSLPMVGPDAKHPAQPFGAVNPPVVRSSTFVFPNAATGAARFAGEPGLIYSRLGNPTVRALEEHIAALEGAEDAVCLASGMAAIHATFMGHLKPGARLVADDCIYGCTHSLIEQLAGWGVEVTWVDSTKPAELRAAIGAGVDLVFLETPMNPTTRMVDLEEAAEWVHAAGGKLVVDNTFATPIGQQPLALGADIVIHSLTKAINGHSDLLGGAVVGTPEMLGPIRLWQKDAGGIMDAETAWQCLRGARTLNVRVNAMNSAAFAMASTLEAMGHKVRHPSLESHPDHEIAQRQMPGGCCVLTIDLGTVPAAMAFVDGLEVFQNAVSLGGFESLASHPASTTHACLGPEAQARAGITPGLVRLSVGLDDYDALLADVLQALPAVLKA